MNYYNDNDQFNAEWLRNLVAAGVIPPGHVDERSIEDVRPAELRGYRQCHFFAGVGGWAFALQLAGIAPTRHLWTASCPCQPFSIAGKQQKEEDKRHLWPVLYRLIEVCAPPVILGEQVAPKAGRDWLRVVRAQLEALGYAVGAGDLCAAGIGAPHLRQRLYFVGLADSDCSRGDWAGHGGQAGRAESAIGCGNGWIADANIDGCQAGQGNDTAARYGDTAAAEGCHGGMADADDMRCAKHVKESWVGSAALPDDSAKRERLFCRVADSDGVTIHGAGCSSVSDGGQFGGAAAVCAESAVSTCGPSTAHCHWRAADWLLCRDAKWRPVEAGTFPLGHGIPRGVGQVLAGLQGVGIDPAAARMAISRLRSRLGEAGRNRSGRIRGYGNAIVPQLAAEFIKAALIDV